MGSIYAAFILVCLAICAGSTEGQEKKVVCYYTTWSYKREVPYDFTPQKIDPFLCTHIIYAFGDIGLSNNIASADPDFDIGKSAFVNVTRLRKTNKKLKIMISIGGWKEGTLRFGRITANDTNRKTFAKNAVRFLRGYRFDGLDLNWQHPTFREGGTQMDKGNYVLLAQALREEFDRDAEATKKPRLLLSIAISHNEKFLPAYDIESFNTYMDFISVICYDYHFSYEAALNHQSPLYALDEDSEYNLDAKFNINYTINYFSERADPEKLVLGIPTYGRSQKVDDPQYTGIGDDADGPGAPGPVTKENGWAAYFEICKYVNTEDWTVVQPKPGSMGPYAYKGNQWISYDDVAMMKNKANYVKEKSLGGVMFWTIDYDDFNSECGDNTFPLIRAARDELLPANPRLMTPAPDSSSTTNEDWGRVIDEDYGANSPPPVTQLPTSRFSSEPSLNDQSTFKSTTDHDSAFVFPTQPSMVVKPTSAHIQKDTAVKEKTTQLTHGSDPGQSKGMSGSMTPGVTDSQSMVAADLMNLIQRAGGLRNLCKILREEKPRPHSTITYAKGFRTNKDSSENTIVFEAPDLPPILVLLSNSSISIQEINVFHKSKR